MAEKIRFHEYLTILTEGDRSVVKCEKCDTVICDSGSNWKENVPYTYRESAVWHRQVDKDVWNRYKEYYCPNVLRFYFRYIHLFTSFLRSP